jgi:hypothetical protein
MNTELFIPPLRDLPPERLALRARHLRAAIADEPRSRGLRLPGPARLRLVPALVILAVLAALALVPIGGASLGSRAIDGITGTSGSGSRPDVQLPPIRPYQPGDKVWTTTPPVNPVAITIPCPNGTIDAARKLSELDWARSPVNEVDCAPGSIPESVLRAKRPIPARPPYKPGDKVWTTEPPHDGMGDRVAITIPCPNGVIDAERKLTELGREGSPVNAVNCAKPAP